MKLVLTPTDKEWRTLGEDPVALCRDALRRVADAALGPDKSTAAHKPGAGKPVAPATRR